MGLETFEKTSDAMIGDALAARPRPGLIAMTGRTFRQRATCALLAITLGSTLFVPPGAAAQAVNEAAAARAAESNVRLPALGESASDEFNINTEKRLGDQIMREIRRDPDYLDDPVLLDYLQSLWQPLVAAARQRGDIDRDSDNLFPYEAFLVRDRSVNAFALPGGYVGVHLGLIGITATRDELASVLAHELSHVTQRHIARSVVASQRSSTLSLAAMLLGILAASRANSPDMAQAAIAGGQAAAAQAQLNFSRDMEREADRNGLGLMTQAGFAPGGMAAMFEKLDQANRLNDSGGFPYLRSHPLTVDRVGEARQRIATAGSPAASSGHGLQHALMQARARVLMDPSVQALRRWQDSDGRSGTPTVRRAAARLFHRRRGPGGRQALAVRPGGDAGLVAAHR
jgi:predicted Zn-dependent protease